jgi:DNA invertase Pin-like site-specific DNA recombinase
MDYARQRGWDADVTAIGDCDQLLRLVRSGNASVALCASLGDLADSLPGLLRVIRELAAHGVVLIALDENVDTSRMSRETLLEVIDAIEDLKHETAREATVLGMAAAVKGGVRLGRPRTLNPHHDEIAALRSQGLSGRSIARQLRMPAGTVFKVLANLRSQR